MTIMKKIIVFTTIGLALIIAGLLISRVSGGEKSTTPPVVPSEKNTNITEEEMIEMKEDVAAPEAPKAPEKNTITTMPKDVKDQANPPEAYGMSDDGTYVVFDKSAVMLQAGIKSEDHTYAAQIIGNWIYKDPSKDVNLCRVSPSHKMASAGSDYLDNPVTQLKWCNEYVVHRYGSWSAALDFYKMRSFF